MRLASLAVAALVGTAHADGSVVVGGSPRAIGRAGTATVGDDGGGALLVNPAAMARRETWRIQLGAGVVDDTVTYRSTDHTAPTAGNQAAPAAMPLLAIEGALGSWVIGVGATTAAMTDRALRPPSDLPATALGNAFDYRYTGIRGSLRRDTLVLGVARRIGDQLAVGASLSSSRITVSETRRLWAGFDGRDVLYDPGSDLEVAMHARDPFVPGAVAGVLLAPTDTPLELGASLGWSGRFDATGTTIATGTTDGPTATSAMGGSRLAMRQPWTARAGARYLGERLVVEVGVDYWRASGPSASSWEIDRVVVRDTSGLATPLASVPSRLVERSHVALRGAVDINVIEGFLWATTGYAYTRGATEVTRLSPTFGELGGHTFALGLEGVAGGATLTLGWSRTFATPHPVARPGLALDNPFTAGDGPVFGGIYDGTIDQLGIVLDLER